jgi:anaerobic selenocysteine-containing dehydrogenase
MTPTAMMADIVLPAATQFEFNDVGHYGLGHGYVLARPKLVDPPRDCKPDLWIINELARALGLGDYWWPDYEQILQQLLEPSGLSYTEFAQKGFLADDYRPLKYEEKGFRTPTGKVELALSKANKMNIPALPVFEGLPFDEDPERQLILISGKCKDFLCSSNRRIASLRKRRPRPLLSIHPQTAASLGIAVGDAVVVETGFGSFTQFADVWDGVHPAVVSADHGWWFPEMGVERRFGWDISNYNMVTSSSTAGKAFGTPHTRAIPCKVRKAAPHEVPRIQVEW